VGKTYENVKLYAEHIDDSPPDPDHLRPETVERGAGMLEVGVVIDGVKKALYRHKAGGFLDDLQRAKDAKQAAQESQTQQGDQSQSGDTQQSDTPQPNV
jgi:hypothetical protein